VSRPIKVGGKSDRSDQRRSLANQVTGRFVRLVVQLLDRLYDAEPGLLSDSRATVDDARNGLVGNASSGRDLVEGGDFSLAAIDPGGHGWSWVGQKQEFATNVLDINSLVGVKPVC
jgi:hypothetical protein